MVSSSLLRFGMPSLVLPFWTLASPLALMTLPSLFVTLIGIWHFFYSTLMTWSSRAMIFLVSLSWKISFAPSLKWKILVSPSTSWVLKFCLILMAIISLKLNMLLIFSLGQSSLIARLPPLLSSKIYGLPLWMAHHFQMSPSIGLVYLTVTRPDIAFVVHQVSQFLSAPRSTYCDIVLRIIRYVKSTLFHDLHYPPIPPLSFVPTLMLIGLTILPTVDPPLASISS